MSFRKMFNTLSQSERVAAMIVARGNQKKLEMLVEIVYKQNQGISK